MAAIAQLSQSQCLMYLFTTS